MITSRLSYHLFFFFFNDTATTEIYTLSLHDALPISFLSCSGIAGHLRGSGISRRATQPGIRHSYGAWRRGGKFAPHGSSSRLDSRPCWLDRKSTRLNSSHGYISYAVFCLKKKNDFS